MNIHGSLIERTADADGREVHGLDAMDGAEAKVASVFGIMDGIFSSPWWQIRPWEKSEQHFPKHGRLRRGHAKYLEDEAP